MMPLSSIQPQLAGELAAMLDGIHDRGDAFDDEEHDQHQRQRDRAADRHTSSTSPAAMAMSAEISDHQKPGACAPRTW